MAFKRVSEQDDPLAPVSLEEYNKGKMKIEIEGAIYMGSHDGRVTIEIPKGADLSIDWPEVTRILTAAGMQGRDADMLTEEFCQLAFERTIGKMLAARCRRVG